MIIEDFPYINMFNFCPNAKLANFHINTSQLLLFTNDCLLLFTMALWPSFSVEDWITASFGEVQSAEFYYHMPSKCSGTGLKNVFCNWATPSHLALLSTSSTMWVYLALCSAQHTITRALSHPVPIGYPWRGAKWSNCISPTIVTEHVTVVVSSP